MSTGRREPRPTRARAGHTAGSSARGAHSRSSCGMYGSRIGRVTTAGPQADLHDQRILIICIAPSNSVSGARGYPARHSKSLASLTQLLCGDMVWQTCDAHHSFQLLSKCVPTFIIFARSGSGPVGRRATRTRRRAARRSVRRRVWIVRRQSAGGGFVPRPQRAPDRRVTRTARRRTARPVLL